MVILGIDPGTATTGYGVIQKSKGQTTTLAYGAISTKKGQSDQDRLLELACDLTVLIKRFKPNLAGVEKLFFTTNQKTVMQVSQSRGVILLTLKQFHIPTVELTPLQVKSMLTGYGKADKKQVQFMVRQTLGLKTVPKPDDAADALAIAFCAAATRNT